MHKIAGIICVVALTLASAPGWAQSSMLSLFPEDVAVEKSRNGAAGYNVASIPTFEAAPRMQIRASPSARLSAMKSDGRRLFLNPPKTLKGETQLGCTAVAVFFESRGEVIKGQMAVASVVLQRALTPQRWGNTPCSVVRPVQFSFMTSRYGFDRIQDEDGWQMSWGRAIEVAATILANGPMPELAGADHYHANYVHPRWRLKMPRTAKIGKHYFYADPDSQPSSTFQ